jgi:O-antigen ligase
MTNVSTAVIARDAAVATKPRKRLAATTSKPKTSWSLRRLPYPVGLFVLALLVPSTLSFYLGELRLSAYRVILLALVIPCVLRWVSGACGPRRAFDYILFFYALWPFVSLTAVHDPMTGLQSGGIHFVEVIGSYLLGRCFIRNAGEFLAMTKLLTIVVIGLAVITVPESITGIHFLRPGEGNLGRRLGLERAFGPFEHPILLGVFCAAALGISYYGTADSRWGIKRLLCALGVIISAFASVSSGPMAALSSQTLLLCWERVTRGRKHRWWALAAVLAAGYVTIACYSNRTPMTVLLYYLTFNAETAYGRITIWDFGTAEVARHPWFGIGFNSWEHPTWISDSIDNFWLCTTMVYGVPAGLALIVACLLIMVKARGAARETVASQCLLGWMVTMLGFSVVAATVHLWNATFVLFLLLLGSGVWLGDVSTGRAAKPRTARASAVPLEA